MAAGRWTDALDEIGVLEAEEGFCNESFDLTLQIHTSTQTWKSLAVYCRRVLAKHHWFYRRGWRALLLANRMLGDFKEASYNLELALKRFPADPSILLEGARLLHVTKKYGQAKRIVVIVSADGQEAIEEIRADPLLGPYLADPAESSEPSA